MLRAHSRNAEVVLEGMDFQGSKRIEQGRGKQAGEGEK